MIGDKNRTIYDIYKTFSDGLAKLTKVPEILNTENLLSEILDTENPLSNTENYLSLHRKKFFPILNSVLIPKTFTMWFISIC